VRPSDAGITRHHDDATEHRHRQRVVRAVLDRSFRAHGMLP
jgi:hypothetical protein